MKKLLNNRVRQNSILCVFALAIIASLAMIVLFGKTRIPRPVNAEHDVPERSAVERSIKIPIDGRVFLVNANVNDHGTKTDDFIRETINSVARYFSVLEWPENRPVEIMETDSDIVVTWPLSPELESLDAFKPDYAARAFIGKTTKEVRFFVGG